MTRLASGPRGISGSDGEGSRSIRRPEATGIILGMEAIKSRIAEVLRSDVFPSVLFCTIVSLMAFTFFLFLFRDIYLRWHSGARSRRVLRELRRRAKAKHHAKHQ